MILIKWLTPLPCYGIHGLISTYHVLPRGHSKLPIQNCALAFKFSIHGRQGYQVLPAQCPSCITHGSRCVFFLIEYDLNSKLVSRKYVCKSFTFNNRNVELWLFSIMFSIQFCGDFFSANDFILILCAKLERNTA